MEKSLSFLENVISVFVIFVVYIKQTTNDVRTEVNILPFENDNTVCLRMTPNNQCGMTMEWPDALKIRYV